jgi:hypothetical protein
VRRVAVGQPTKLTVRLEDAEGGARTGLTVDASVADESGNAVASGTATDEGSGEYSYIAPAPDRPGRWTVIWTPGSGPPVETYADVVGRRYSSIAALRQTRDLDSVDASTLDRRRTEAAALFEDFCGTAWTRRYGQTRAPVESDGSLWPGVAPVREIRSAQTATGNSVDVSGWTADDAHFNTGRDGGELLDAGFVYGQDTMPADLYAQYLVYVRYLTLGANSDVPDRATSFSVEGGTFEINQAGAGKPTGLPEVDAALRRHQRAPVAAAAGIA